MKTLTFLFFLFLCCPLFLGSQDLDQAAEEEAIGSLLQEMDRCLQEKNLEELSRVFSTDAELVYIGLSVLERAVGWKDLQALLKSQFETTKIVEIKARELDVFFDDPQMVRYSRLINLKFVSEGILFAVDDIRETGVLRKSEGHWFVIQQHASAPITDSIWPFYLSRQMGKPMDYDVNRMFRTQNLKEDFDLLWLALEEAHPGLYRYTAKEEFDGFFRRLFSGIDREMTEIEFFRYVCPIIEKIHCLHTWIRPSEDYQENMEKNGLFFPLELKFIHGKAFAVKSADSEIQVPPGSHIISIDGSPVSKILTALKAMFPSDGINETYKYRVLDRDFAEKYYLYIDRPDFFRVEYLPYGEEIPVVKTIPAIPLAVLEQSRPSFEERYKDALKFEILEQQDTAVLTIETFVPRILDHFAFEYEEFLHSSFQEIKEKNIQNLIIDLRDNDGGEGLYGAELLSYLLDKPVQTTELIVTPRTRYSFLEYTDKGIFFNNFHPRLWERGDSGRYILKGNWRRMVEPKALRFKGRVFILINGMSISATSGFSSLAHHHKRAVFVGEETGGAYYSDNGGDYLKLTLPYTGLRVNIPVRSFTARVSGYPYSNRGVIPDHEVVPTVEDILQGRDAVLEFTLSLIDKLG